jgi:hypothetical protein
VLFLSVDEFNSNTISANWDGADPHSGIATFTYAIGETANGTELIDWTSINLAASFSITIPEIQSGIWYYTTIRATNGAGLESMFSSNGFQILENSSGLQEQTLSIPLVYPNPAMDLLYIQCDESFMRLQLFDSSGKMVFESRPEQNTITVDMETFSSGLYLLHLHTQSAEFVHQIIKP